MAEQPEPCHDVAVAGGIDGAVDDLGAEIPPGGLQEHGFIKAAPDVLRRVHEVLDASGGGVNRGSGGVESEIGGLGEGEGADRGVDGGEVGGDGLGGGFHGDDGVGRVDEVSVSVPDELAELLLLGFDLLPRGGLNAADLGDGF